ncbi:hypothetical protein HPA02_04420 [Bisbaumannia pacifica]|uniref:Uncharacterized protein n=1 Tax=Bisbaumannia pacifica TaxID=77098 RepID=A0A510X448_9GAMM|nr:hypothetical protein HPA02_04420 [Halomonas pacifica]
MSQLAAVAIHAQQAAVAALLGGVTGDQLLGELIVKVGALHGGSGSFGSVAGSETRAPGARKKRALGYPVLTAKSGRPVHSRLTCPVRHV